MEEYTFLLLFHILFVSNLFIYIGTYKTRINKKLYKFIYWLSIIIIVYHLIKSNIKIKNNKFPLVNYLHIFLIGPLLLKIGLNEDKTPYYYYELLTLLGFGLFGHNFYKLLETN